MDRVVPLHPRDLRQLLRKVRVIPGVKNPHDLKLALSASPSIVFFLTGSIFGLRDAARHCSKQGALLFAHVDLLQGIGKDAEGMRFLAEEIGIQGILSTRSYLIRAAAHEGLLTIQRVFALDSEALKTGFDVVRSAKPDAIEILPALVVPSISHRLPFADLPPVIAGGLLETPQEVETVLGTPVVAVSTSSPSLWVKR